MKILIEHNGETWEYNNYALRQEKDAQDAIDKLEEIIAEIEDEREQESEVINQRY